MALSRHALACAAKTFRAHYFMLVILLAAVSSNAAVPQCNFPNCAYVTDGAGREVLAASTTGLAQVWVAPTGAQLGDLTVGPDKKLYVALTNTNQIAIVDVSGTTATSTLKSVGVSPQGLRFAWNGDLYFNSTTGLRRLPAPNYSAAFDVATANFTRAGGVAFRSDGSVLFAGDNVIYLVPAVNGIPSGAAQSFITVPGVTGLAVDNINNVYLAHDNVVDRYKPDGTHSIWADFTSSADLPQHIEVVPDMVLGATCNTISDLLWVSTYQFVSGKQTNGKVWRVGNTSDACTSLTSASASPAAPDLIASITTKVSGKIAPAIGAGVGPSYRTLTKTFATGDNVHTFHFGGFSHELENALVGTTESDPPVGPPPCDATVTAVQRSPSELATILGNSSITASPIRFYGEQGWVTTFLLNTPSCFTTKSGEQFSDHYINGFFSPTNPKVVNLHATNGPAVYTATTGYFPSGPGSGTPGDPGIGNRGSRELFLVNETLTAATYTFSGFLSPLRDPASSPALNVFNAGQNITFKFQLFTSNGKLLSDTLAQDLALHTVFALAQLSPQAERESSPEASGQSIKDIPRFKYDAKSHQFLYTLDSGALNAPSGTSTYEATVVSDTPDVGFLPHSLQFTIQN